MALAIERGDYDPARGSFRGWLFRIARDAMINTLAAQKRHPKGTGDTAVNELLEAQPAPAVAEYRRGLLQQQRRHREAQRRRVKPKISS